MEEKETSSLNVCEIRNDHHDEDIFCGIFEIEIIFFVPLLSTTEGKIGKIKNMLRVTYIEDMFSVTTNGFILLFPQTKLESNSLEIVYLHVSFGGENNSTFHELRRIQCKLNRYADNKIWIEDEIILSVLSEKNMVRFIEEIDNLTDGINTLTHYRKIINDKNMINNFLFISENYHGISENGQLLRTKYVVEICLFLSNILLSEKRINDFNGQIQSTNYFGKDDISYLNFIKLILLFLSFEKCDEQPSTISHMKLNNIVTRLVCTKERKKKQRKGGKNGERKKREPPPSTATKC